MSVCVSVCACVRVLVLCGCLLPSRCCLTVLSHHVIVEMELEVLLPLPRSLCRVVEDGEARGSHHQVVQLFILAAVQKGKALSLE